MLIVCDNTLDEFEFICDSVLFLVLCLLLILYYQYSEVNLLQFFQVFCVMQYLSILVLERMVAGSDLAALHQSYHFEVLPRHFIFALLCKEMPCGSRRFCVSEAYLILSSIMILSSIRKCGLIVLSEVSQLISMKLLLGNTAVYVLLCVKCCIEVIKISSFDR